MASVFWPVVLKRRAHGLLMHISVLEEMLPGIPNSGRESCFRRRCHHSGSRGSLLSLPNLLVIGDLPVRLPPEDTLQGSLKFLAAAQHSTACIR